MRSPSHSVQDKGRAYGSPLAQIENDLESRIKEVLDEISIMSELQCPYVVNYLGAEREAKNGVIYLRIFMEYMSGGSISSKVKENAQGFQEGRVKSFVRSLLLGLKVLHEHSIAHRDIKGANLLLDQYERVKLCDFGTSIKLETIQITSARGTAAATASSSSSFSLGANKSTSSADRLHRLSTQGTPFWMAPEVMRGALPDESSWFNADIWSVGCTMIEMCTGHSPWPHFDDVMSGLYHIAFNENALPELPLSLSSEGKAFLKSCLQRDPKKRPTVDQLLQHEWLHPKVKDKKLAFEDILASHIDEFNNLSIKEKLNKHRKITKKLEERDSKTKTKLKNNRSGQRKTIMRGNTIKKQNKNKKKNKNTPTIHTKETSSSSSPKKKKIGSTKPNSKSLSKAKSPSKKATSQTKITSPKRYPTRTKKNNSSPTRAKRDPENDALSGLDDKVLSRAASLRKYFTEGKMSPFHCDANILDEDYGANTENKYILTKFGDMYDSDICNLMQVFLSKGFAHRNPADDMKPTSPKKVTDKERMDFIISFQHSLQQNLLKLKANLALVPNDLQTHLSGQSKGIFMPTRGRLQTRSNRMIMTSWLFVTRLKFLEKSKAEEEEQKYGFRNMVESLEFHVRAREILQKLCVVMVMRGQVAAIWQWYHELLLRREARFDECRDRLKNIIDDQYSFGGKTRMKLQKRALSRAKRDLTKHTAGFEAFRSGLQNRVEKALFHFLETIDVAMNTLRLDYEIYEASRVALAQERAQRELQVLEMDHKVQDQYYGSYYDDDNYTQQDTYTTADQQEYYYDQVYSEQSVVDNTCSNERGLQIDLSVIPQQNIPVAWGEQKINNTQVIAEEGEMEKGEVDSTNQQNLQTPHTPYDDISGYIADASTGSLHSAIDSTQDFRRTGTRGHFSEGSVILETATGSDTVAPGLESYDDQYWNGVDGGANDSMHFTTTTYDFTDNPHDVTNNPQVETWLPGNVNMYMDSPDQTAEVTAQWVAQGYDSIVPVKDEVQIVRALSQYFAQEESELSLNEGDQLQVRYKDVLSGWWEGVCVSSTFPDSIGCYGWFPSNFVALVRELYPIVEAEDDWVDSPSMGTPLSELPSEKSENDIFTD
eukprot:g3032.t1